MEQQRAVRSAWEQFLADGRASPGIPQSILSSWERSRALGVSADRREAPTALEPEVFRRRAQSAELLNAARPALSRSEVFLAEASSMMILADADGVIIETAGDPRVIEAGHRNRLEIGGRWEEAAIGTNAIGTALRVGQAIQVCGAEHFCEDVQRWTCAAKPIRHPADGETLGVVDISGPVKDFNPQSLALAFALGQEIEASLGQVVEAERETLLRSFLLKRSIWLSEDILVVDRRGLIVHTTENVQRRLEAASRQALAEDIRNIFRTSSPEAWERNCRRRFPNASLEFVKEGSSVLGYLIVIRGARGNRTTSVPAKSLAAPKFTFDHILGESCAMRQARERALRLAANSVPVLIEGETGVGKELFARAIYSASEAARGPFVPVNCGGLPRELIATELFGYTKGAFTGADQSGRIGKIEYADGGVLCLDEIGEMPLELQPYLLRVLEDGVISRVGSPDERQVNVRLISMTNRDLLAEAEAGRFRRDLYYRVATARIRIPPLRERGDDVLLLADYFARGAADRLRIPRPTFTSAAQDHLRQYNWPGNVRELRNVIETMIALVQSQKLDVDDLPDEIRSSERSYSASKSHELSSSPSDLAEVEKQAIFAQIRACDGNLTEAARRLGIARSTLYVRLAKYGYRRPATG